MSRPTLETLHELDEPIEVVVFLSRNDPLSSTVRHMLTAYRAESPRIVPRFVDPDRDPAEFLALQQKYGIVAGKAEDGRVVTDAAMVMVSGENHWFITADEMVAFDPEDGSSRPRLEQRLTEGLRNVLDRERPMICFSSGHQERRITDGGPAGLIELTYRLEKNNYEVAEIELGAPRPSVELRDCRVLVIAGPDVPLGEQATTRAVRFFHGGGNVLVLANTVLDDELRPVDSGLEPIERAAGMELGGNAIIERDPAARTPNGVGERFLATPEGQHPVVAGLVIAGKPEFKVLVTVSQSVEAAAGASPAPLLETTEQAFAVGDVRPFLQGKPVAPSKRDERGPLHVAMATELPQQGDAPHGPRMVVVGTSSVAWGQAWRDPALVGNRLFVENAISWLAAEPALVSIPERDAADVGVSLTEQSLNEVWRYVLIYMPVTALLLGIYVIYRRRVHERRSRRAEKGAAT